jgi:predicted transcriptional regulator
VTVNRDCEREEMLQEINERLIIEFYNRSLEVFYKNFMIKVLRQFELSDKSCKVKQTATDTDTMFVAEPFEAGFAHNLSNVFRRIILGSRKISQI